MRIDFSICQDLWLRLVSMNKTRDDGRKSTRARHTRPDDAVTIGTELVAGSHLHPRVDAGRKSRRSDMQTFKRMCDDNDDDDVDDDDNNHDHDHHGHYNDHDHMHDHHHHHMGLYWGI